MGKKLFQEFIEEVRGPLHIYTDGACSGNPGNGGFGIYMHDEHDHDFSFSGYEENTTNNRMEMLAAITALEFFVAPHPAHVTVYTDSKYLQNGIQSWIHNWKKNNWKTAGRDPVKNQDLWMRLDAVNIKLKPLWEWVPGHSHVFGNERADALARNAIIAMRMR